MVWRDLEKKRVAQVVSLADDRSGFPRDWLVRVNPIGSLCCLHAHTCVRTRVSTERCLSGLTPFQASWS